jgi:hypothetical protein
MIGMQWQKALYIAFELWKMITVAVEICQAEKERNSDRRVTC